MNPTRRTFTSLVAAFSLIPKAAFSQRTPQELLVGVWLHSVLVRSVDGNTLAPQKFEGESFLEFKGNGTWVLTSPYNTIAGTYRWLESGAIETTTLESGLAIQIGTVSKKQVRVDSSKLELITIQTKEEMEKYMPPAQPGVRRPTEVVVTSTFTRKLPE